MAGYDFTSRSNPAGGGGNRSSDHVCRPVIVDADGKKRPFLFYSPNVGSSESYVTERTERVVEHVRAPVVVAEYNYSSQARVEQVKDYGVTNDKWVRTPSPSYDSPEFGFGSPKKVEPGKSFGLTTNRWRWPSSPVYNGPQVVSERRHNSPTKVEPTATKDSRVTADNWHRPSSPAKDRPAKVEDSITKVQTEVSRPTRPGIFSDWRNPPNSTRHGGTTGYGGESANPNNTDRNKPSANSNTIWDESLTEPTLTNKDAPERPGFKGWRTIPPPPPNGTPISRATNDIGKGVEALKEAAMSPPITGVATPPRPRFSEPASIVPKRDVYTETIDSREAARRYGNFNGSSGALQTGETYTGTINSREAAQKYKGTMV